MILTSHSDIYGWDGYFKGLVGSDIRVCLGIVQQLESMLMIYSQKLRHTYSSQNLVNSGETPLPPLYMWWW
jgi:hypothetical protein